MNNYFDTEELTTSSIVSLFETTKTERKSFVEDLVSRVVDGQTDVLKTHAQVKSMESIIKEINDNKEYKECLLDAAAKQGGKSFELYNAKFETKEVGVKYDFYKCEDPEMDEMVAEMEKLKEKIKAKESFLKTVALSGCIITNDVTGETYKVFPPAKSSTTTVAVTLK